MIMTYYFPNDIQFDIAGVDLFNYPRHNTNILNQIQHLECFIF